MGTVYLEILFFLQFVSPALIQGNTHLANKELTKYRRKAEKPIYLSRKRRNVMMNSIHDDSEEEEGVWDRPVCRTHEGTSPLASQEDHLGNGVLVLGSLASPTSQYQHYVKTHRCVKEGQVRMVGGVNVKCVQKYLEERLVVYNNVTGRELFRRPIFLPSGCEAMMESYR